MAELLNGESANCETAYFFRGYITSAALVLGFGTTAWAELPVITGENRAATDNNSKLAS